MKLSVRSAYLIALSLIALLTITAQGFIQLQLIGSENDARVINVSGRQRMLSQRISKTALTMAYLPEDARSARLDEMKTAFAQWQQAHSGLQVGDAALGLPANQNEAIAARFEAITPAFETMRTATTCLIGVVEGNVDPTCTGDATTFIDAILNAEQDFLRQMDEITFAFDAEAAEDVANLRTIELLLTGITLGVLVIEGLFIFRPAIAQLNQAQRALEEVNQQLEQRVLERTEALQASNQRLQTANEEIQDYANAVSHDLRSPIASMRGFLTEVQYDLTALKQDEQVRASAEAQRVLNESLPESIEALRNANERMDRLTHQILEIARAGERPFTIGPTDAGAICASLIASFSPQISQAAMQIQLEALPKAQTDALALEQVFSNLLSNAIKYRSADRPARLRIRGHVEGADVIYAFEDNGRGIAADEFDKVFQLFRRAGRPDVEGEGIGLYFVRYLLTRLNGSITFTSQIDVGTTFFVRLPKSAP